MRARQKITLGRLFAWTSVYAVAFGGMSTFAAMLRDAGGLSGPLIHLAAAIVVVSAFVAGDIWFTPVEEAPIPRLARSSVFVSYYATAFALSVILSFGLSCIAPPPLSPPAPDASYVEGIFDAIGKAQVVAFSYLLTIGVFSVIGFISSLFALRRYRSAKWLALVNIPGTLVFAWFVVIVVVEMLNDANGGR